MPELASAPAIPEASAADLRSETFWQAANQLLRGIRTAITKYPIATYFFVVCFVAALLPGIRNEAAPEEHTVEQARAFLNGRLDLAVKLHDTVLFEGKYYQVNPPFPSTLLMPLVLVLGKHATAWYLMPFVLFFIAIQIRRLCLQVASDRAAPWVVGGTIFGTGLWFCLTQIIDIWFIAHLVSFACLLTALVESLGRGRGYIVGLALACSFLSRQATVDSAICFAGLLWVRHPEWKAKVKSILSFGLFISAGVGLYLLYNWIRFHDVFNTGYGFLQQGDYLDVRQRESGIFHVRYIIPNAVLMFLNGFNVILEGHGLTDGFRMGKWGTSLTFASPFLLLSLGAKGLRRIKPFLFLAIIIILLHILSYHANGWVQLNTYRYTLDFIPFVLPFLCVALDGPYGRWVKVLIIYSVVLNCLALIAVPLLNLLYRL